MAIVSVRFRFVGPTTDDIGSLAGPGASISTSENDIFATWKFDDTLIDPVDMLDAMRERGWDVSVDPATSPTVFVYRPGSAQGGSIFGDWSQLFAAYLLTDGPAIIEIDDSIVSPAVVPAGTWAFRPDTALQGSFAWNPAASGDTVLADLVDGCVFDPPPLVIRNPLRLNSLSSSPIIVFANDPGGFRVDQMTLERGAQLFASGTARFIQCSRTDGLLTIGMSEGARLSGSVSAVLEILGDVPGGVPANVTITALNVSTVDPDTIASNAQGLFIGISDDTSDISATQSAYTGTRPLDNSVQVRSRRFLPTLKYDAVTIAGLAVRPGVIIQCDPLASGPMALTLPPASSTRPGDEILVKNITGSPNTITVSASGTDTIDTAPSLILASPFGVIRLISDGSTNWMVI